LTVVVISHDFAGLENRYPRTIELSNGALQPVPASSGSVS
jgi:hypothetical protein